MIAVVEHNAGSWVFQHHPPEGVDEEFNSILEIFDAPYFDQVEADLKALLLVCPEHIDALHHLALIYADTNRPLEAYLCSREAVRIGIEAIPSNFSWLTSQLSWAHLENRPFMRAYHFLAIYLLRTKGPASAIDSFARLVAMNPNDNLGARYMLMQCLIATGGWEPAILLTRQYPDDVGPDLVYSKAVAQLKIGDEVGAIESLRFGVECKPNVASELLKPKHIRPKSAYSGYITSGGEDEAFDYWERNRSHWGRSSKPFKLLCQLAKK
jgi:tetratricopeptide (TPR) repeat protein